MANSILSLREVVVKNINCVVEGVSNRDEVVDEILDACFKEIASSYYLNNLTLDEAKRLYEMKGVFLFCGDGRAIYADTEGLNQ